MHVQIITIFRTFKRNQFWLLFTFAFYYGILGCTARNCINIPVSLDNFEYCSNNTCYFSQQVSLSIPATPGASTCLELVSPDGTTSPIDVVLSISDSYFMYSFDYLYHTDDPRIDIKTFCGCPSGAAASCPTCGPNAPAGDVSVCLSGTHTAKDCPGTWFGQLGTWCAKMGLTGLARYRIYHALPNPKINIDLQASITYVDTNETNLYQYNYQGNPTFYTNTTVPINVTLVSSTSLPVINGFDYVVVDMFDSSDFYVFDSSEVNSQDGYDVRKLGWYKSDIGPHIDVGTVTNSIQAFYPVGKDCNDDEIDLVYNFLNHARFLTEHANKLSVFRMPNSILSDADLYINPSEKTSTVQHFIEPYYYIQKGWIFYSQDGFPLFVGITENGVFLPSQTIHNFTPEQPVLTNTGWVNNTAFWNAGITCWSTDNPFTQICILLVQQGDSYGICLDNYWNFPGNSTFTRNCVNATFDGYLFPSWEPVTFYFDSQFKYSKKVLEDKNLNKTIYSMINNGVINVNVEFRNFSVRFDSTSVKPIINSILPGNGFILLTASSATVGGVCYVSSDPAGLIIAQPITLAVTQTTNNITFSVNEYNGNVNIDVRCYKNDARKTVFVDFNLTPSPQPPTNNNVTSDNKPGLISGVENVSKSLWSALSDLWNSNASIWDRLVSVGWWILTIIGGVIIITIILYLGKYLFMFLKFLKMKASVPKWLMFNTKRKKVLQLKKLQ